APGAPLREAAEKRGRQFAPGPQKTVKKKTLSSPPTGRWASAPPPADTDESDEYVSDPAKPVPFTEVVATRMTVEYMTDDQRFAARRPDVLAYQTDVLTEDVTLAGPILADLRVSTSGTDSDWVVKLIDVFSDDAKNYP